SHTTKTLGDTHPYAAIALREWAMTCDLLNEHDLARQLLGRAEKILLKSVGEQHAFYADLLTVLATHNQFHGNNLTQAQNQWNHALFIYLDLYDENHPQVQFVIRMLVNILINQQNGDNQ
ncbi:MAG: tetratricopeptide repeat protein, partial [Kingella sp. (in: b-proteobacteria)]